MKIVDFGCVYAPATEIMYYGGLTYGAWKATTHSEPKRYGKPAAIAPDANARVMMGFRDRKINPSLGNAACESQPCDRGQCWTESCQNTRG